MSDKEEYNYQNTLNQMNTNKVNINFSILNIIIII